MTDDLSMYTPRIIQPGVNGNLYGEMLVELVPCPSCQHPMLAASDHDPFPKWRELAASAQVQRAGWRLRGRLYIGGQYICAQCEAEGRATFVCALCKQSRPSDQRQEAIGDPPEYLCTPCYETVPAKAWDHKRRRLEEEHRYDFE